MRIRFYLIFVLTLVVSASFAQAPKIDNIQPVTGYPVTSVLITGTGFSNNQSDLQVWFGNSKGVIESATITSIKVKVPAQAKATNVEVVNLATKLSAKSAKKFFPNFSGKQPFTNTFTSTAVTSAEEIFDLCTCDFDGDGKPDIVGSKKKDGQVNLLLLRNQSTVVSNNSTMSFASASISLNAPTNMIACGDLNGDGKAEIIATRGGNTDGSIVYVLPNISTGAGNFSFGTAVQLNLTVGDFGNQIVVRDLTNDGKPEIIVTNAATNTIYIFENKLTSGTITAGELVKVEKIIAGNTVPADNSVAGTLALEVEDFTGDGWPEIMVAPNKSYTSQKLFVFVNPANQTLNFASPTVVNTSGTDNINDISSADFNNDGRLDLVLADKGNSSKSFVLINQGALLFTSVNGTTGFLSPTPWGVEVGDLNGDGFADFAVGNRSFTAPQFTIYINNQAATPGFTAFPITTPKANWFARVGDYDGDAKPDVAMTSTNNSTGFSIDIWKNKNCHLPVILNDNPLSICNGQTIALNAVAIPAVSFSWSTGDAGPVSNIDFSDAGTITVTAIGEGGACSAQSTITVNTGAGTAPAKPTITGPNGVCAGSALSLSTTAVSGSPTYIWTGSNGFASNTTSPSVSIAASATPSNAGDYVLRIKVGDCTSAPSDPKNIIVVAPASFTISSSAGAAGVCTGQPVTLSVNSVPDYNYQWKKGASAISGQTAASYTIPSAAGTDEASYTVLVSHQTISCSSETQPFSLNVFTTPVSAFTISPENVCVGTLVTFNASSSTVDNSATVNYVWDFGDSGSGSTTVNQVTHTYVAASASVTSKLTINYTGVSGCSHSITKNFAVSAQEPIEITATPNVTEICRNGSESVELTITNSYPSISWSTGANTVAVTVTTPATYTVTVTTTGGCVITDEYELFEKSGCGETPSITVQIPKAFTPNGDTKNDNWVITTEEGSVTECVMNVFDGRGRRVHEIKGYPDTGWDGVVNGKPVPDGTYYYVMNCPGSKPVSGSVLIVR